MDAWMRTLKTARRHTIDDGIMPVAPDVDIEIFVELELPRDFNILNRY